MARESLLLFLGLLLLVGNINAKLTRQQQFLEDLLTDYDVNDWPTYNTTSPTKVEVQLFINSFGSLNAANMDYTIDVFLRQYWMDPRLQFDNGREQITITNPAMQKRIWKPDTFFNNVKDAEIHRVTMDNILLRVNHTGGVLYSMRITLKLSCNLKLEHFPFDQQRCGVTLASYANTDDVIKYEWHDNSVEIPDNLEISEFDMVGKPDPDVGTQHFATGDFSELKVIFVMRRQNGYHVLQTYIPTILIVAISWVSFFLDPNAVPGRVSLGVTTLLTLTTLASGIRQSLPPVSYVKAIDVWVGMCMIMVFGALLEFTFVNWLANKKILDPNKTFRIPKMLAGSDAEQVGALLRKEVVSKEEEEDEDDDEKDEKTNMKDSELGQMASAEDPAAKPPATYMMYARALDRLCRLLFPGGFLFFNLCYWPYYLMQLYSELPTDPEETGNIM